MSLNRDKLATIGYPRSGNTFLAYALRAMYFSDEEINKNIHSSPELYNANRQLIIVPFRNPADSISSWFNHGRNNMGDKNNSYLTIENVVLSYEAMMKTALLNIEKIVLFDFAEFTQSLDYIKNKVETYFDITSDVNLAAQDIVDEMTTAGKTLHIPNEIILDDVKEQVIDNEFYARIVDSYNLIVEAHQLQS